MSLLDKIIKEEDYLNLYIPDLEDTKKDINRELKTLKNKYNDMSIIKEKLIEDISTEAYIKIKYDCYNATEYIDSQLFKLLRDIKHQEKKIEAVDRAIFLINNFQAFKKNNDIKINL